MSVLLIQTGAAVERTLRAGGEPGSCVLTADPSRLSEHAGSLDVAVIGGPDAIRMAQSVRSIRADAAVLIVSADCEGVRGSLRFMPNLPQDLECLPESGTAHIAEWVAEARERVHNRRTLQEALARANRALVSEPPAQRAVPQYLDRLLEIAPVGVVSTTLDGCIVSFNATAASLLDATGELQGNILDCFRGESRQTLESCMSAARSDKSSHPVRNCRLDRERDGARIHLDSNLMSYRTETGSLALLFVFQDVTSRVEAVVARDELLSRERRARKEMRAAVLALEESERRLRLALHAGRMGTWEWDAASNRVIWSASLEAIYGLEPGGFRGSYEHFLSLIHPEDCEYVTRRVNEAGVNGPDYEIQFRIVRPDGAVRSISDRGQVLFDENGAKRGIIGVCWDDTERRSAEAERERLTAELAGANALLDALFENAPVGLGLWDRELRYVRVNHALAQINGAPPEQHVGRRVDEVVAVDPGVVETFRHVIETGEAVVGREAHGETPAQPGVERYWSVSYYPVRIQDEIVGAGAVCEEITSRKRIEHEMGAAFVREQQARGDAEAAEQRAAFLAAASGALNSSLDYIGTLNSVQGLAVPRIADACLVDVVENDGSRRRLSSPNAAEYLPAELEAAVARVVAGGTSEHASRYLVVPVEQRGEILGAIAFANGPQRTPFARADLRLAEELAGRVGTAVVNARLYADAEQRRIEAENAAAQLARVNTELEQFAYVASHDLQEPLRTIGSYAQLLERRYSTALGGDAQEFIGRIVDGVRRMKKLIEDLLEYSRLVRQEEKPSGHASMRQVVDEATDSLRASIAESGAVIRCSDLPELRDADSRQLLQLMQNLIGNAIKYRRPGVPPDVRIEVSREHELWHFVVRDNGQGFTPEHAHQIFEPFKRLHGREIPGSGIGLAVCKRLVERHGGRIWADGELGVGSAFHFTIPA